MDKMIKSRLENVFGQKFDEATADALSKIQELKKKKDDDL